MNNHDITQNDQNYKISVPLSGVSKKDISLQVEKGMLFVSAKRNIEIDSSFKPLHEEFALEQNMNFSYSLGENVDQEKIDAKMENGFLVITLGKKEEAIPKTIIIS